MTPPRSIEAACDEMRQHLRKFDWTSMTNGRRQILEAFLKLAIQKGYTSVTMRGLAAALDVKASSIYFHFPGGRDEIVGETLRWHYFNWGRRLLTSVENSPDASDFWDNLVRAHVRLQLTLPESDLWDILVATDRIYGILRIEDHAEVRRWLHLCVNLYEAASFEMGCNNPPELARIIMSLLDGAGAWCDDIYTEEGVDACMARAVAVSRTILASYL